MKKLKHKADSLPAEKSTSLGAQLGKLHIVHQNRARVRDDQSADNIQQSAFSGT